jgi:hypothetical protein
MSNHRQATAPGPSLVSIIVMALATLSTIGVGIWIMNGATDERHLAGAALGFVLAVVLTAQTMGRAWEHAQEADKRAARQRRFLAEAGRRTEERASEDTAIIGRPARVTVDGADLTPASRGWPQPIEQVGPWEDRHPTQRLPRPERAGHQMRSLRMPLPPREEPETEQYPS